MDLSKIRVIIADDDVFKGFDIRKALEFNGVRNIMTVRNQEKLWEQIYHGEDKIDLIVTDMQYPLEAGEAVDEDAGFKLIKNENRKNRHSGHCLFLSELQHPRHLGKRMVGDTFLS